MFESIEHRSSSRDLLIRPTGNYLQLKKDRVHLFSEWIAKYGDHFGMYNGAEPVIVCSDLDTIKEILVKVGQVANLCDWQSIIRREGCQTWWTRYLNLFLLAGGCYIFGSA